MTTMREYVDGIQGEGSWDRMHDRINKMELGGWEMPPIDVDGIQGEGSWDRMHDMINKMDLGGWEMPPIDVDGKTVHVFPGTNREVTLEQVQNEIRKTLNGLDTPVSWKDLDL